jgi:hypothetical protein
MSIALLGCSQIGKMRGSHGWQELDNLILRNFLSVEGIIQDDTFDLRSRFCFGENDATNAWLFTRPDSKKWPEA